MKIRVKARKITFLLLLVTVVSAIAGAAIVEKSDQIYSRLQKAFYLPAEAAVWIRPGLNLEIMDASVRNLDSKVLVTFRITDDKDQGLDRDGIFTPGEVSITFVLAYLPADGTQYVNYNTRLRTNPVTGATVQQAIWDSGGTFTNMGDGVYRYTSGTALPAGFDQTATHTVAAWATRDLEEFGLSRYVANATLNFVPDGRQVTKVREVVSTAACNQCHDPLALHGGRLRDVKLCVLCHQPQSTDADTGNTVDFKVMIHKIHRGADLPSVEAGTPYQIGSNDFSDVEFPRDIRNCTTCHRDASQADNRLLNPSAAACGSCHDDVNFQTGENHPGGRLSDDRYCHLCHFPEGEFEYDASIAGAHIPPYKSKQLRRPSFEFLDITNTGPGQTPTVQFRISDKDGIAIAPADMDRVRLYLAGPTSDYQWRITENATGADYANGLATYTFSSPIPEDAAGSAAVVFEGRLITTITKGIGDPFEQRDVADNLAAYFSVTDAEPVPRRAVVATANCNVCHDKLQMHGSNRNQVEACVICHNPIATDEGDPAESIHFKILIHKIHTGEDLENDYIIDGHNFKHVRFPGDRRNCAKCHEGNTFTVPLPSVAIASTTPRNFWSPTLPTAAACMGCHDSISTAAHAYINTAFFGESCDVCHEEGADFGVSRVHAR